MPAIPLQVIAPRGAPERGEEDWMRIEIVPVLADNYAYLVVCESTGQAAVVDPADAEVVHRHVARLGVTLAAVWCTHHHGDHTAGVDELAAGAGLPVVGHASDAGRIDRLSQPVRHGDEVAVGELRARVLHTPGHTRGSICYLVDGALLCGDTLFAAGCGRLFEGDAATMFHSLTEVLRPLPPGTQIYCGHEYTRKNLAFARAVEPDNPARDVRARQADERRQRGRPTVPFSLQDELDTNPFLRCEQPTVQEPLRAAGEDGPLTPLRVFTLLRERRNSF